MKNLNFNILLIVSLFSSACFFPSKTDISYGCTKEEPSKNEIIGDWITNKATLESMKERGKYDSSIIPKLIFHEDGKFEAFNMPDWWLDDFGKSYGSFEPPSSGTWRFSQYKERCVEINLSLQPISTSISLSKSRVNQEPKYIMTKYIGDPDSNNLMIFVKEK